MEKNSDKVTERVVVLDTTTRYKVDGSITVKPEDYESGKLVSRVPRTFRARVALAKNGGIEMVPLYIGPSGNHRYKELFVDSIDGRGCIVRQTQNLLIIRVSADLSLPKRELERQLHSEYLKAMSFIKAMKEVTL